jgi:hypothetical protein
MPLNPPTSDSPVLYTVTCDATLRIFIPVLDSPQSMQLHATLDLASSVPSLPPSPITDNDPPNVFALGREVLRGVLTTVLADSSDPNDSKLRRLHEICDGGWDLFMQIFPDGSLTIRAVAASTLPVIWHCEPHRIPECRSATSNSPQAAHRCTKHRYFFSSHTFVLAYCSWTYQTLARTSLSTSPVCACPRAFELLRFAFR